MIETVMTVEEKKAQSAVVFEIQRMSTEDGPGIRTTVFFKGCTLKCKWCHNPESISLKPQIHWNGSRCIGCKLCIETCPNGALSFGADGIEIDRKACKGCGMCAEECPSTAMELFGAEWSVDDLVREVEKDRAYFEKSGGGITVSGGEATVQAGFVAAFLKELRGKGIRTALDTCGMCAWDTLERILPHADMILYDMKEIDPEKHREFTGSSNEKILDNLVRLKDYMNGRDRPGDLWVRTPIIPGATDTEENIRGIGEFIAENLGDLVGRWDLCSFNNLCVDKYSQLGMEWAFRDCESLSRETMERLSVLASESGVKPGIVRWSGATKIEEKDMEDGEEPPKLRLVESC